MSYCELNLFFFIFLGNFGPIGRNNYHNKTPQTNFYKIVKIL